MATPHHTLIVCHGVAGTGGGSTCAYALFRAMRADGIDVRYLTVVEERDEAYYLYMCGAHYANPDRLDGASCCVLRGSFDAPHPELAAAIAACSPSVVLAVGDLAAILATGHAGAVPVVLFLTGADDLPERRTPLEARPRFSRAVHAARAENENTPPWSRAPHPCFAPVAARTSYLVVAPSEPARQLFVASYPSFAGKVHPRAVAPASWLERDLARFQHLRRAWPERDIGAIFVANRWRRSVKGLALVEDIVEKVERPIVVVGEGARGLRGVEWVGLKTDRAEYLKLLGRARAVVCPSNFELSSTLLYEGVAMGCNVVASADCGNVEVCDPELVATPGDAASFAHKIELASRAEPPPSIPTGDDAYRDLIETLAVV